MILKGKFLDMLVEPFSSNQYYREFLSNLDSVLPAIESYTITCTCEHGTVTGTGDFVKGASFRLCCTPDEGYYLHGWTTSAGTSSISPEFTGVATANLSCQAIVTADPSYVVSAECICGTVTGTGLYSSGDTCTLTCVPSTDHEFSIWSDGDATNPRTFTITEDLFLLATCIPEGGSASTFMVTTEVHPESAADVVTLTGAGEYESRGSVTVNCIQESTLGVNWLGWYDSTGSRLSEDKNYTFNVTKNTLLWAKFTDSRSTIPIVQHPDHIESDKYYLTGVDVTKKCYTTTGTSPQFAFNTDGWVTASALAGYKIQSINHSWVNYDGTAESGTVGIGGGGYNYSAYPIGDNFSGFCYEDTSSEYPSELRVWATTVEETFKVHGSVNNSASGSISATLDGSAYTWGTEIPYSATRSMTVTFTPNTGYSFGSFKIGNSYVFDNPCTFTVTEDTNIVAISNVVAKRVVNYSVSIPNGGDIQLQDEDGQTIESGDEVLVGSTLTASYDLSSHYNFSKWIDNTASTTSTGKTYVFTVPEDTTTTTPYSITLEVAYDTAYSTIKTKIVCPTGSSATISGYTEGGYYWKDDVVQLSASLSDGTKVVSWAYAYSETGTYTEFGTSNPVTFICPSIDPSKTTDGQYWIKLTTALKESTFNVSVPNADSITATVGGVAVTLPYSGHVTDVVEVTVAYDTVKYSGIKWSDGSGSTENPRSYTLWSDSTYTLTGGLIAKSQYTVQVVATNGTVAGAGTYYEDQSCTLTCTPSSGYKFVSWTYAGSVVSADNPYIFTVNSDVTLVTTCILDSKYLVTVTTQGSGSVDGAGEYDNGSTVTLTATTDDTREIKSITDNGTSVTVANPYEIASISENHTVVYNFGYKDLSISQPVGVGGSCKVYYGGVEQTTFPFTVTRYSMVEFVVTPATGWHFVKWDDDVTASADRWITVTSDLLTLTFTCEEDTTTAVPIPTTLINK